MHTHALDSLVSLRTVSREGSTGWTTGIIAKEDGRVRIRRIGSETIECDLSPALALELINRGDLQWGARKVWRYTGNQLATLAATLGHALAQTEMPRATALDVILHHVALISAVNLTAWAQSFGIERCDVADLEITVADLRAALPTSVIDLDKSDAVLATLKDNLGGHGTDSRYPDALVAQTTLERVMGFAKQPPAITPNAKAA